MVENAADEKRGGIPGADNASVYFILKKEGLQKVPGQEYRESLQKAQSEMLERYRQAAREVA